MPAGKTGGHYDMTIIGKHDLHSLGEKEAEKRSAARKNKARMNKVHPRFIFGEADDPMSELLAIYSISSVVGMLIGLSSKVRISLM